MKDREACKKYRYYDIWHSKHYLSIPYSKFQQFPSRTQYYSILPLHFILIILDCLFPISLFTFSLNSYMCLLFKMPGNKDFGFNKHSTFCLYQLTSMILGHLLILNLSFIFSKTGVILPSTFLIWAGIRRTIC